MITEEKDFLLDEPKTNKADKSKVFIPSRVFGVFAQYLVNAPLIASNHFKYYTSWRAGAWAVWPISRWRTTKKLSGYIRLEGKRLHTALCHLRDLQADSSLGCFDLPWTHGQTALQSGASICGRVILQLYSANSITKLPTSNLSNGLVSCGGHVGVKSRRISLMGGNGCHSTVLYPVLHC